MRMSTMMFTFLQAGDVDLSGFNAIRAGLAEFLMVIFGFIAAVSLVVVVYCAMQGDRETAKKATNWCIAMVLFFVFTTLIRNLNF